MALRALLVLLPAVSADINVSVFAGPKAQTRTVNKFFLGCHFDSGFTQQPRGIYSQMIYGESFEVNLPQAVLDKSPVASVDPSWSNYSRGADVIFNAQIDDSVAFHGLASQKITFVTGSGVAGVVNRGIGHEGLFLQGGKEYEGYLFVTSAKPVKLVIEMHSTVTGNVLAAVNLDFAGGNWTQVNFTLTPSESTECVGADPTSCRKLVSPGHVCVDCGGEILVGLAAPGEANIDFVYVQPGEWGRFASLPILQSAADIHKRMGVSIIRHGGSFILNTAYFWKNWRGAPFNRPSTGWTWQSSLVSGWGPFEMIDYCNAAGIEPVITTTADTADCCSPEDMADFVEYCWGNSSTTWGAIRINEDNHPQPYKVRMIELGNEQYNTKYVDQVIAMEARAALVGQENKLVYLFPNNGKWLDDADGERANKLGLGSRLVSDIHTGGGGGLEVSRDQFAKHPSWTEATAHAETNAGNHHMGRALSEASDLNGWFNAFDIADRLIFRTASFCAERSGHFDAYDQGLSFFLPNMTWLQPPGYVHALIKDTWQPNGLVVTGVVPYVASAQQSDDAKSLVVRLANLNATASAVTLNVDGVTLPATAVMWTIQSANLKDDNTPSLPDFIAPTQATISLTAPITIPGQSYNVIQIDIP